MDCQKKSERCYFAVRTKNTQIWNTGTSKTNTRFCKQAEHRSWNHLELWKQGVVFSKMHRIGRMAQLQYQLLRLCSSTFRTGGTWSRRLPGSGGSSGGHSSVQTLITKPTVSHPRDERDRCRTWWSVTLLLAKPGSFWRSQELRFRGRWGDCAGRSDMPQLAAQPNSHVPCVSKQPDGPSVPRWRTGPSAHIGMSLTDHRLSCTVQGRLWFPQLQKALRERLSHRPDPQRGRSSIG